MFGGFNIHEIKIPNMMPKTTNVKFNLNNSALYIIKYQQFTTYFFYLKKREEVWYLPHQIQFLYRPFRNNLSRLTLS